MIGPGRFLAGKPAEKDMISDSFPSNNFQGDTTYWHVENVLFFNVSRGRLLHWVCRLIVNEFVGPMISTR